MKYLTLVLVFSSIYSLFGCISAKDNSILPDHHLFSYEGRIDKSNPKAYRFSQPGVNVRFQFEGKKCTIKLRNDSKTKLTNYYNLIIDNEAPKSFSISNNDPTYFLELQNDGPHLVTIFRKIENFLGIGIFEGIVLEKDKKLLPVAAKKHKMEFIGNSITCGYGIEGSSKECHFSPETENNYLAYSATTARNLDAEFYAVAYSGIGMVQNYEIENKQTMPVIYDRILADFPEPKWDFKQYTPDVVVLNLGTNDFAHFNPDSTLFANTYFEFVKRIRKNYPKALIFCLEGCMTNDYYPEKMLAQTTVRKHITNVVTKLNTQGDQQVYSYFFSGMKEDELGCDWHPNVKKHQSMAAELTSFIKSKTGW